MDWNLKEGSNYFDRKLDKVQKCNDKIVAIESKYSSAINSDPQIFNYQQKINMFLI